MVMGGKQSERADRPPLSPLQVTRDKKPAPWGGDFTLSTGGSFICNGSVIT